MAYLLGPKEKRSRAIGENLFLKADRSSSSKSAVLKKPYRPGLHGKARKSNSEFGLQLREKQKARIIYGVRERQFRKYHDQALRHVGKTAAVLAQVLERRLDSATFRCGFAISRSISRQLVNHGHVLVNGKKQRAPSYQIRTGDVLTFSASSKNKKALMEKVENHLKRYDPPAWLSVDPQKLECKVTRLPELDDVNLPVDFAKIIEFYSR